MRALGSKSGVKNETPKLPENRESLGKLGFFFSEIPIFLTQNSILFNGFPIFFNGFLLSSMAFQFSSTAFQFSSMAFCFLQRFSTFREIRENLYTAASIQKITI
jgi:hypothetical protein